jgi:hypothetical protein
LGRWLAGAPDRWADRAFVHLVNHAQRMLVRNLTEQAWQRAQLGTARSERARARLRAALVENGRRAAQIRATLRLLPSEYQRRQTARHEAARDRLQAQLARKSTAQRRVELARVERALAGVATPPLHRGRYLRRVLERHEAELARLGQELREVRRQLAITRDADRVRALRALRDRLQAERDAGSAQVRRFRLIPGAEEP